MGPMTTTWWFYRCNCTSGCSSMMFPHAEGYGMGLYYESLTNGLPMGEKWAIDLLFYPFEHLTLKKNGAAL
jgi:hypothetical protein